MRSLNGINRYNRKGLKTGLWETYWRDGIVHSTGLYKNGLEEGIWEEYWDNGNLHSKGLFKNGKEEGIWLWYNTKGVCINDNL